MTKKYVLNFALQNKNGTIVPIADHMWGVENLPFHELSAFLKHASRNIPNINANKITGPSLFDDNNNKMGHNIFVDDDIELFDLPAKYYEMMAADPSIVKQRELIYLGNT